MAFFCGCVRITRKPCSTFSMRRWKRKEVAPSLPAVGHTSNFINNMRLPIHRWFRYSAGFSAEWVKLLLAERDGRELTSSHFDLRKPNPCSGVSSERRTLG